MVSLRGQDIRRVPLADAVRQLKLVPQSRYEDAAAYLFRRPTAFTNQAVRTRRVRRAAKQRQPLTDWQAWSQCLGRDLKTGILCYGFNLTTTE